MSGSSDIRVNMPLPSRFRNCWLSRSRVRGGIAVLFFVAGGVTFFYFWWLGLIFTGMGIFTLFEALRGWCLARACGVKTKL